MNKNKALVVLFALLMLSTNVLATESLDSLKQLLSQSTQQTEKAVLYNTLTWLSYEQEQDSTLDFAFQALSFAQEHGLTHPLIIAELQLADVLRGQEQFESCIKHINKASALIENSSFKKESIRLLFVEGNLAYSEYRDDAALQLFKKCYPLSQQNYPEFCYRICTKLVFLFEEKALYKEAEYYLQEGLAYSKNIEQKIELYTQLGNLYTQQQQYEQALGIYKNNASLAIEGHFDVEESNAYLNMGNIHLIEDRWIEALNLYLKSAVIKEKIKDQEGLAELHQNIAVVYKKQQRHDKSIEYYTKCEDFYKTTKDSVGLIEIWTNIAVSKISQGKYEQALELLNQVLIPLERYPMPSISLLVQMNLGFVYMQTAKYQKALVYFKKSALEAEKQQNELLLTSLYNYEGANYFYLKDYVTSIEFYQKALVLGKKLKLINKQKSATFGLYESNDYLGNAPEALNWHKQYVVLKDSLYNTQTTNRIAELQEEYDAEQKEQAIQHLNVENKNIALENELKTKQLSQFLLIIIFGGMMMLLLGFLWLYRNKQQQERLKHAELLNKKKVTQLMNQQEIEMLDAVVDAQQKERKGIAKEIHDTLGNFLATLKYQHEAGKTSIRDTANKKQYELMEHLIVQTSTEVRSIAHQMATGEKFDFNWSTAIGKLVERIQNTQQFNLEFNSWGLSLVLPRDLELTLYRIIQELLSNILKHAQASQAILQINQSETEVTITVEDNGRGFDLDQQKVNGLGLNSIQERVHKIKGQLNIDSHLQHGTTVVITIPIP